MADVAVTLTGVQLTSAAGTVSGQVGPSVELAGHELTTAPGSLTVTTSSVAVTLMGHALAIHAGGLHPTDLNAICCEGPYRLLSIFP